MGRSPEGDGTLTVHGRGACSAGAVGTPGAGERRGCGDRRRTARQVTAGAGSVRSSVPLRQTRHRPRPAQSQRYRVRNRA